MLYPIELRVRLEPAVASQVRGDSSLHQRSARKQNILFREVSRLSAKTIIALLRLQD